MTEPVSTDPDKSLAQAAYEAVSADMAAKYGSALKLHPWDQLPDQFRATWSALVDPSAGKSTAQIAYEAYAEAVGGINVRGEPLPTWDELVTPDLGSRIQDGWHAAVNAVQQAHYAGPAG
jgi:hypothetical protein